MQVCVSVRVPKPICLCACVSHFKAGCCVWCVETGLSSVGTGSCSPRTHWTTTVDRRKELADWEHWSSPTSAQSSGQTSRCTKKQVSNIYVYMCVSKNKWNADLKHTVIYRSSDIWHTSLNSILKVSKDSGDFVWRTVVPLPFQLDQSFWLSLGNPGGFDPKHSSK